MNPRIVSGMSRALFDSDLVATRLALFLSEALWAIMLFWPGDTFARPTYSAMGLVAPELVWATAFALSSITQLGIVVYEKCHQPWAKVFSGWNALLWVAAIILMLLGVYPPPAAIGGEIALTVSAIWIAVRPLILQRGERKYAAMF